MKIIVALVLIIIPAAICDIYAHDRSTLLPYLINKPVSSKQHGQTSSTTIRQQSDPTPQLTAEPCMHVIDLPACRSCLGWDLPFGTPIDAIRATWTVWRKSHVHILPALKLQGPGTCMRRSPSSTPPLLSMCILYTWMEKARRGGSCARPSGLSLGVAFVGGGAVAACNCSRDRGAIDGSWMQAHQGKEEHPYSSTANNPANTWAWYAWSLAPYDAQRANEGTSELSVHRADGRQCDRCVGGWMMIQGGSGRRSDVWQGPRGTDD